MMAAQIPVSRPKARSLLTEARLPVFPRLHTGDPFTSVGDVVLDCDGTVGGRRCGWHAMGPRADVKKAYDEHRKLYHSIDIGVVLLNRPRQ
jgi:hypothetical protein